MSVTILTEGVRYKRVKEMSDENYYTQSSNGTSEKLALVASLV
ncbi:hypothetical protein Celal_3999 [Cellulophaga algicola DSM 14237]|uniref:Uncharacterized protein n=1 Tax=Cellulophaga algicola (strain DSM 14237 / IC166 / ACAM 630) TaxID=688270 RepID=E6XD56_CELAD|nr:hypothetical protein Celal_3999 [Cellulophaga algicola DSM 14237]